MSSKIDADKIVKDLDEECARYLKAKDLDSLVRVYHPDAVLVHRGLSCAYGHDQLYKAFEDLLQSDTDFTTRTVYTTITADGQFIVRIGKLSASTAPDREFDCEQVYRKYGDRYVIYNDSFEFGD